MRSRHWIVALASLLVLGSGEVIAQETEPPGNPPPRSAPPPAPAPAPSSDLTITLLGGGDYQFDSTLDNGGEMSVGRIGGGISLMTRLGTDLTLRTNFGYELNMYDFKGPGFAALQPWDDVHTLNISAQFVYALDEEWSLFGGPIIEASREEDGDWDDSWTAGGVVGATLRVDEGLTVGLGIGVISQLQDSARWFPAVVVEAELSSNWRLTTRAGGTAGTGGGVEAIYDAGEGWEFGFGGRYRFRRFRLDNEGTAAHGVGQEEGTILYGRIGYDPTNDISMSLIVGVTLGAEFEVESAGGVIFAESDYDPAAVVGFVGTLRF
ncbi:MAG: hypothetical protein GY715_04865 [Planctomycetes bacterium]|nr:hypothetical protein [Planctomycetota bacterium]